MSLENTSKYSRRLGLPELVALGVGGTVGSGIFVVPGLAAAISGSTALVAWGIIAVSAVCTMFCFKWTVSRYPGTGALYTIFSPVYGRVPATLLVILYLISTIFGLATIAAGLGQYFFYLGSPHFLVLEFMAIGGFCVLNIHGIRGSGLIENILTILKIIPLFLIALLLLPVVSVTNIVPFPAVTPTDFLRAVLLVYWPFTGFEISAIPAEEVRGQELIGRSLVWVMAIVVSLYILLNISLIGALGSEVLASSPAPLATAAGYFLPKAGVFIALVGIIAMLSALNAYLVGGSRVLQGLADGYRVRGIRDLNRWGTPAVAIVLCSALTIGVLLLTNRFEELAVIAVITTLVPYLFIGGASFSLFPALRIRIVSFISMGMTAGILFFSLVALA